MCVLSGCTITSKAKIKIFTPLLAPLDTTAFKKKLKTFILAFEANSALSRQIALFCEK
jgi:hypothetical protein